MSEVFNNMPLTNTANYQPTKPLQQEQTAKITVKSAISASNPIDKQENDSVEISAANSTNVQNKTEKKGPIKTLKTFIANVKKFFSTTGEYAKGTLKGITTGAVAGSVVYTGGAIINSVKSKAAQKAGKEASKIPNKLLAGIVAVGALAANIWTASLNATEKQSAIDHRWTGHNQ